MFSALPPSPSRSLRLAIAISLIAHALVLLLPSSPPEGRDTSTSPLQARLAPLPRQQPARQPVERAEVRPAKPAPSKETRQAKAPESRPRVITARKPSPSSVAAAESTPTWSVAQKEEMNRFRDELSSEAKARPQPSLAERSMAMAREMAREGMREGGNRRRDDAGDLIERIPDSPPVAPFSLEFYLDALVKKLNRSASFVKNDPRTRGIHGAAVEVRLNPDGSLKSFKIVQAGDQQEEIAFVRSVVERAVPFAAFPPDIVKSARSLALMICIQPAGLGGDGFGFTRRPEGSRCS